ncbi:FtsH protease activity modulator HflK [Thioalkalivibrio sp. HK1]|uniref:FtsH protease activity modulator HflK n=1 Tax=Thioalkalivibrio sp. HK1 TaxID=1469245 RepID=UPI000471BACB|nr:FtsH protease activity modulator HflK [Thioalkalivibrio sp. HK1]
MAWNQSGGGDQDPWSGQEGRDKGPNRDRNKGQGGGQSGPPDLDEILRKLQQEIRRWFGRGGSSNSSSPETPSGGDRGSSGQGGRSSGFAGKVRAGGSIVIGLVAVVLLAIWWLAGVTIIQEPEEGVVLRFGHLHRVMQPGFNWAPKFIDTVEVVNVDRVRVVQIGFRSRGSGNSSVPREALMLTKDENIVDIQFTVQYKVDDSAKFLYQNADPETALVRATESVVREIIGRTLMRSVITEERATVADEADELIQEVLDLYRTGLRVTSVDMQDGQPPEQVQAAFSDAIKAREDQERIINEAKAYEADVVPKARGEANAILARSQAYRERVEAIAEGDASRFEQILKAYRAAPDVTRDRLYLEAVESVLANTSKVLVDIPEGNNLMYLPLDQIVNSRRGNSDAGRFDFESPTSVNDVDTAPSGDLRSRNDRSAGRSR